MFQVFRRHQKRLLAVVTILAMFAFVFPLGSTYFSNSNRARKTNVEVKDVIYDKPITNQDIDRAKLDRQVANVFVAYSLTAVDFRFAQFPQEYIDSYYGFGQTRDEEAIKDAIRLAHKADLFGIKVSDDVVRAWIKDITGGKLTTEKFRDVVAKVARMGEGFTAETLFDILRNQLRIQMARQLSMGRVPSGALQVTPYETWQYYRRLNDKLEFEVIPVAVDDFTDRIDDPGDDALLELYRQYVSVLPHPASPDPGFKEPRKLNLQYASASLEEFSLSADLEITEAEIAQYYESHKELYRVKSQEGTPVIGPAEVPEKPKLEPDQDEKKESPASENDAEPKKEVPEKPSSNESSSPEPDCNDAAALSDPLAEPQDPPSQEIGDANQDETQPSPGDSTKKSPGGSGVPKPEPPDTNQDPANDLPEKAAADDPSESQEPDEAAMPAQEKDEPTPYKPLEEVAGEIRDLLRKDKARAELAKRLEQMGRVVSDFGVKVYLKAKDRYEVEKETNPDLVFVAPAGPDFSQPAADLGLKFGETGLVGLTEDFAKIPGLGEAMQLRGGRMTGRTVPDVMSATDRYDPIDFKTMIHEEYFTVWKTDDVPEREPTFAEARERVLTAYRIMKARELAKEHAAKLADTLRELSGDIATFQDRNPEVKPQKFGPISLWSNVPTFSMNTAMGSSGRIHPTELTGLEYPTDELRSSTFKLKEGDVTVAPNEPENTFYVVLVTKHELASLENFARSRALMEDQLLQVEIDRATREWLQALRDESKGHRSRAPAGN